VYPAIDHRRGSPWLTVAATARASKQVKPYRRAAAMSALRVCVARERLVDVAALLERAVAQLAGRRR